MRLALLVVMLAFAACKTTSSPDSWTTVPTPGTTFGHCSSQAISNTAESLLGAVTTALATGDYAAEVAALATKWGSAEVGCAIDLVIAEFSAKAQRTPDAQTGLILARARAVRGSNP